MEVQGNGSWHDGAKEKRKKHVVKTEAKITEINVGKHHGCESVDTSPKSLGIV